ncbi:hypothetical protein NQ317_003873 [Molorchus minor]|uniref:DEK-C domain-containing protein n=1 Tax=Molorchus minor TaxID=1323400 RepID=A0ABQ9JDQ4_9CUCU|nr:hypothetical protein NQ317_003873 [Molorchus minor]
MEYCDYLGAEIQRTKTQEGANLEEITMKTVCQRVYDHYPDFDLTHKKDFIKSTVKSVCIILSFVSEFKNSWYVTPGMRQAKTHIEGPSLKLTKCLLGMNRRDIRMVTGLLTGHCHLNRHLQLIGIAEDPECRWCLEDEETSSYVLTECPAIARVRERHFGSSVLNPEDVKRMQPRKLCTFAKEFVPYWMLRIQI